MDLTLVTCRDLPEPDADEQLLLDALGAAGVGARTAAWDDPDVDWGATPLTVVRSTWNYVDDRDGFLEWMRRASSATTTLRNPLSVMAPNTHKGYLAALERADVPTVPTRWFARGARHATEDDVRALPWSRIVVKPAVGAGSKGVRAFDLEHDEGLEAAAAHAATLQEAGEVLVQPQLRSIVEHGEANVVWIAGEFTHAVHKGSRLDGDDEQALDARPVSEDERTLALRALRTLPAFAQKELLYARVDMAPDELGTLRVVELELVEPSLFLRLDDRALERFVHVLAREAGATVVSERRSPAG